MMAALRLLVARLRRDHLPILLLSLVVALSAGLAAAVPRLFTRAADDGLRHEVRQASVVERNAQLGRITRVESAPGEAMNPVDALAAEVRAELPASVRDIMSGDSVAATSVAYSVLDRPPARPGFVTLTFQDRLDDEIRLVDGRMPAGDTTRTPAPDLPPASIPIPAGREAIVFEAALSRPAAETMGVSLGDRLHLVPDRDDTLVGGSWQPEAAAIDIVGIFEVVDPTRDFWVGDRGLHEAALVPIGINVVEIYVHALLSPEAYPAALQLSYPFRYAFRHTVDAERLDAGRVDALATDLRRMEASYASFANTEDPTRTTLQWALLDLLDAFAAERRTSEAVLTTTALGPAAVATAAVAVLALLAVQRRRGALALIRARGGSAPQLLASHLGEGLLLTAAPAALGALVATSVVASRSTPMSWTAAALVALAASLVFVGAAAPAALRSLRAAGRDEPAPIGASPRRLAFEALAVGLAIGGVFLLRERGLVGGSATGDLAGVDPFLAAVPVLVGVAVGAVTVRVAPYPIRAAGWLAASGRGIVASLGLRRAERQSGAGQLPLLVVLLTVAIGTFSSTMLATIDRGQVDTSWRAVGAAYRITGSRPLPEELDVGNVPGVAATAGAHEAEVAIGIGGSSIARLVAIDAAEYAAVVAGTPAEIAFPDGFDASVDPYCVGLSQTPQTDPPECPGTERSPIPIIVSQALVDASTTSLRPSEVVQLTIAGRFAYFRVAEVRDTIPTLGAGRAAVMAPRHLVRAAMSDRPLPDTTLLVRGPADAAAELRGEIAASGSGAALVSQAELVSERRARPLVAAVGAGFLAALGVSIAYAALAVVISMLLAGAARARETAQLRTMGVGRAQIVGMTLLEHGPPVIVAMAAGLGLGLLVAWVVTPGLGLAAFTGGDADPALTIQPVEVAVLAVALAAIVGLGVIGGAWAQRRIDPATAVREGTP
jgi:putative ABC transport system permease protein